MPTMRATPGMLVGSKVMMPPTICLRSSKSMPVLVSAPLTVGAGMLSPSSETRNLRGRAVASNPCARARARDADWARCGVPGVGDRALGDRHVRRPRVRRHEPGGDGSECDDEDFEHCCVFDATAGVVFLLILKQVKICLRRKFAGE